MSIAKEDGFSLQDLEILKLGHVDRIQRIETDLKCPLDPDLQEQAGQLSRQVILMRLLEIERTQLRKVKFEIAKRKNNS